MPGTPNCHATRLQRSYVLTYFDATQLLRQKNPKGLEQLHALNAKSDINRLFALQIKLVLARHLGEKGELMFHRTYIMADNISRVAYPESAPG